MASWVCRGCSTVFAVGAVQCPSCQQQDAYEHGGDDQLNVYDAVEATGIKDPGAAWATVNEGLAAAVHEARLAGENPPAADALRSRLLTAWDDDGQAEVDERLGLVPCDPGTADASTDPEPVEGESAGSAPARKRRTKDVPS